MAKTLPPPVSAAAGRFKLPAGTVPNKIIVSAVEGWGKTSLGAYCPNPVFIMPEHETGYLTLASRGRVPKCPYIVTTSWKDTLSAIEEAAEFDTIILDGIGGVEAQCLTHTLQADFAGNKTNFDAYQKGIYRSALNFVALISALDRTQKNILCLSHLKIKTFHDPTGADFDRYVSDLDDRNWNRIKAWSDAALFGTFLTVYDPAIKKAVGGTDRMLYTEHRDIFDAKNRYGLAPEIAIPAEPDKIYGTFLKGIFE